MNITRGLERIKVYPSEVELQETHEELPEFNEVFRYFTLGPSLFELSTLSSTV
eukprot:CAMPEP_0170504862 /NCGR_PEP_ID=MMETSP0208-20121228/49146_1 /TAXON_ID=197538 /ORGANISM="Strombidium inclinatum, Strain S3" /LENGTH=52 /DNA_ID=CAMNT_0010785351 /DNA_START=325 /DNA_END=483 /DNA_ORIENTATION=-